MYPSPYIVRVCVCVHVRVRARVHMHTFTSMDISLPVFLHPNYKFFEGKGFYLVKYSQTLILGTSINIQQPMYWNSRKYSKTTIMFNKCRHQSIKNTSTNEGGQKILLFTKNTDKKKKTLVRR